MATLKVLVVGAWGWGWGWWGWGGWGWKVNYDAAFVVTPQAYAITVWTWGVGGNDTNTTAGDGSDGTASIFSSITSAGWLWGKRIYDAAASPKGNWWNAGNGTNTGGISPRAAPNYPSGWWGWDSWNWVTPANSSAPWGNWWPGTSNSISWSAVTYGWGWWGSVAPGGTIGTGTDGWWDASKTGNGIAGAANRWWGWGWCANAATMVWWTGWAWVVVVSYATDWSDLISTSSTGGTITTNGWQTIHTFTTSGTFTMVSSLSNSSFLMFFM